MSTVSHLGKSATLIPLPLLGRVLLILQDGRAIVVSFATELFSIIIPNLLRLQGTLAGHDQKSNIILADCKERIYSLDEPVEEILLGLYLVKGDMMCVPWSIDTIFLISHPY